MQLSAGVIVLLTGLWLLVPASLLGLLNTALSQREDKSTRLLGLVLWTLQLSVAFALAMFFQERLTNLS